jgi:hypothetical protein
LLCGRKALKSKVPSWRCVTGIERGASSAERTSVKASRAETMLDSGRWKAGWREEMMFGVRTKTEGFLAVAEWDCECGRGRDWRSGRKVWSVRIGIRRRVLRRSEKVLGESVAIGDVG